tara:strand:- start:6706 stop:7695 length:990 start_codon:yes stop_codon:yes gene_type:complete
MLGFVLGVLLVLLVLREVANLSGANDQTRFVERPILPIEEPSESSSSPRGLKERESVGANRVGETDGVGSLPPPPNPMKDVTNEEVTQEQEEVKESVKEKEPEEPKDDDVKTPETNETELQPAKAISNSTTHVPIAAIGGGFHVKDGHIVDDEGDVIGASVVDADASNQKNEKDELTEKETDELKTKTEETPSPEETTPQVPLPSENSFSIGDMDPTCGGEDALDLDGPALSWGLDFKVKDAGECCAACKQKTGNGDKEKKCNSWVFCPQALCWAPDIWNHTFGECWLKVQEDVKNPVVNFRGDYPREFRQQHSTAPERVAWQAGVLAD